MSEIPLIYVTEQGTEATRYSSIERAARMLTKGKAAEDFYVILATLECREATAWCCDSGEDLTQALITEIDDVRSEVQDYERADRDEERRYSGSACHRESAFR